jgi:hypothetical protein
VQQAACYRESNPVFSLAVMLVGPKMSMGPTQFNSPHLAGILKSKCVEMGGDL